VDERGDDERRFGGPSTVDGRPADARGDGDAFDGEAYVSLFLQDLEGRGEDRLIAAGIAGSTRTPAFPRSIPFSRCVGSHDLLGRVFGDDSLQTLA
jgi:hypothetical protein